MVCAARWRVRGVDVPHRIRDRHAPRAWSIGAGGVTSWRGHRRSTSVSPGSPARRTPRELVEFGGGEELGGGHLERGEQLAASSPLWPGGKRKPVVGGGDAPDRRRPNSTARLPTKAPRWLAKWISPKAPLKALELPVATGLSLQTKKQDQCHRRSGSSASSLRNRPNVQRLPCAGRCPPSMRRDQFAVAQRRSASPSGPGRVARPRWWVTKAPRRHRRRHRAGSRKRREVDQPYCAAEG